MYDSRQDTLDHIAQVRKFMGILQGHMFERSLTHDKSKLQEPEKQIFDEYSPKLKNSTYGSEEYKSFLKEMKVALDHHYCENRHHPEHFKKYVCNGCFKEYKEVPNMCDICGYSQFQEESHISQMTLVDLCEMISDWKAATLRHNDGDILKSIEINQKRFGYSDELKNILLNTVKVFFE